MVTRATEPGTDNRWQEYWINERMRGHLDLGLPPADTRLCEHGPDEVAHYAKKAVEMEDKFPLGWSELEGIANRAHFDLSEHQKASGQDLSYYDPETDTRCIPAVRQGCSTVAARKAHPVAAGLPA